VTPLFHAASRGSKELVQLLLSHGARASVEDKVSKSWDQRLLT
jgi:ankyrin repeat protein